MPNKCKGFKNIFLSHDMCFIYRNDLTPSVLSLTPHTSDLRLLVVLHRHGDDVEPYDDGDEQVQVVAGAHLVDEQTSGGVIRVVGLTLSFCWKWE